MKNNRKKVSYLPSQEAFSPDHSPFSIHFLRKGPILLKPGMQWYSIPLLYVVPFTMIILPCSIIPGSPQSTAENMY